MHALALLTPVIVAGPSLAAHVPQPRRHWRHHELARNVPDPTFARTEDGTTVKCAKETESLGFGADWLVFMPGPDPAAQSRQADVQHLATGGMKTADRGDGGQSHMLGAQSIDQTPPSAAPAPPPNSNGGLGPQTQNEVDQWLKAHNEARAKHNAGPLQWREDLSWGAKSNAERCKEGHTAESGENIASSSSGLSAEQAVAMWIDHASLFNGRYQEQTAHFTQVVWKSSQYVGCFTADCEPGTRFPPQYGKSKVATCRYDPPGNNVTGSAMTDNVN